MDNKIVDELNFKCRERGWMVKAQTRLTNQMKAITRSLNQEKLDRAARDTQRRYVQPESEDPEGSDNHLKNVLALHFLKPLVVAQQPIKARRKELEKEISALATKLPVWEWAKAVRGIGPLGIGLLVGAAGYDLANYSNPAKLWKRFGLAPGQRRYTDKQKAIEVGYAPQRRSLVFNISEALMKQNDGVYRQCYVDRKAYLMERSPEWKLLRKPKRGDEEADGKVAKDATWKYHNEALRYLGKRFLRDLWRAWRDLTRSETHTTIVSPGEQLTGTE